jgi:hypothetical protein
MNPTQYVVPGKAKLIDDKVERGFADRLENPSSYTVPGKAKLKGLSFLQCLRLPHSFHLFIIALDDRVEEKYVDMLENPNRHTLKNTANLRSSPLDSATTADSDESGSD